MKYKPGKLEMLLLNRRSEYLNNISALVQLPHLKSRYRCVANTILDTIEKTPEHSPRACPKCLLQPNETQLKISIKPQMHNRLIRKYQRKKTWTMFQNQQAKGMQKLEQKMVVKCSTCKNIVKHSLKRPQKPKIIKILDTPLKTKKKRKKSKNDLAGINKEAVEEAKQHARSGKDFISLELTPAPSKKRKFDEVIVIEDSPMQPVLKKQNNQQNQLKVQLNANKINIDINEMKQQAKIVEEERKALPVLATKKDKRKMKHKLKKLQDSIKNIEHNTNKPNSLQNFLNTICV